jgi:hypothetical protein
MHPPVVQLESQRRELARTLGLAGDEWAAPAPPAGESRKRPRARRRVTSEAPLRPTSADRC